jgi:hypothetical protein
VVVDDVEHHGDPEAVSGVDESAQPVRAAVLRRRREERRAVVAPVARSGEARHRHQLDRRHAKIGERRQPVRRGREGPFRRERPDVQLVEHDRFEGDAAPGVIRPGEGARVDQLGRAVHAVGLGAGGGIREGTAPIDAVGVPRAGVKIVVGRCEEPVAHGRQLASAGVGQDQLDPVGLRRPQAQVPAAGLVGPGADARRPGGGGVRLA